MRFIREERKGDIAILTLARAPLNILNTAMLLELRDAALAIDASGPTRLLVLRAEGKVFSAGADVGEHLPEHARRMIDAFSGAVRALHGATPVTIACLQGSALGGGLELALACDLVLACQEAQLGQPEIKLGVFPPVAMAILPLLCQPRHAIEMILTGEPISAEEARRLGLVNKVFAPGYFDDGVADYISRLAQMSPSALRLTKATLRKLHPDALARLDMAESEYHQSLMRTEDAVEGLRSFLEKRPARWKPLNSAAAIGG